MSRNSDFNRLLNGVQLIVEACVAVGFLLGLIPFMYLWSSGWVLPLTVISCILSFVNNNRTTTLTLVNLAMALISFIPIVGFITRFIGIIVSLLNIKTIRRYMK